MSQAPTKTDEPADRQHHRPAHGCGCGCGGSGGCGDLPELARLRYFHGQPLSALDLRREQTYHRDRARLHNRLLHGWGVVCGLEVRVAPRRNKDDCDPDPTVAEVVVHAGRRTGLPRQRDRGAPPATGVRRHAPRRPRPRSSSPGSPATVYLTLCYHETPIDPTRPMLQHGCEPTPACEHARILDSYRICATLERPDVGPDLRAVLRRLRRRLPRAGGDPRLHARAGRSTQDQVDISGRRALALRELTEIVGINWVHGATYTRDDANALLDAGLRVWFSRGVQVASLTPGVFELTGIESGGGRSASSYTIEGEFVDLPNEKLTTGATYRRTTGETLQYGDRLLVTVRGDFILDECCRALDADHLGGGVPLAGEPEYHPVEGSHEPVCPPRTSGDGVEGGEFVSWIYVEERGGKG